ncbi:MAG: antibiotic biosynthesis monooxygenase family protein [Panacagrimonas sp.]
MVIELVTLTVKAGQESGFEDAMVKAKAVLLSAPGSHSVMLARGVESPSKYILQIEWDAVESHVAFTKTEGIVAFRGLVGPFFAEKPHMEHFAPVA